MKNKDLVKTKDVLQVLNISQTVLNRLKKEGKISFYQIGKQSYRYNLNEIKEVLKVEGGLVCK